MNAITILRQELHTFIDEIPAKRLTALKPLLADLAEPGYVIETEPYRGYCAGDH